MAAFYEPGVYQCQITEQSIGESKNGNSMILFKFKVIADEQGHSLHKQYERTYRKAVTEKTIDWVVKDLRAIGFEGESFAEFDPQSSRFQSVAGKVVYMYCKHEGEYERWEVDHPETGGGSKELDKVEPAKIRKLDGLFGKALKASANSSSAATAQAPPTASAPAAQIDDDDIPF